MATDVKKIITDCRCEPSKDNNGNPVVPMILKERNFVKSIVKNVAKKSCLLGIHVNVATKM